MERQYLIIVEGGHDSNYSAYAPDVPGCVAAADTLGECIDLMQEALRAHFEVMAEYGEEIPASSSSTALYVNVPISEPKRELA
jgi:predicted RNase H-like HicB family nuclease